MFRVLIVSYRIFLKYCPSRHEPTSIMRCNKGICGISLIIWNEIGMKQMKRIPKTPQDVHLTKTHFPNLRRTNFCPRFVDIFTCFFFVDVFFLFSESTMVNHQEKSFNHRLPLSHPRHTLKPLHTICTSCKQ